MSVGWLRRQSTEAAGLLTTLTLSACVLGALRILLHCQVYKTEVVKDLPLKWRQIHGPLEAADGLRGRGQAG